MTWFRVDDKFHGHRKVLALFDGPCPGDAIALWTLAGSWVGDQLNDGVVPVGFVRRSGLDKRAAAELVRVKLWKEHADGFEFVDWHTFNPSRAEVEAEREATRKRVNKHRNKPVSNADCNAVTAHATNAVSTPSPSRPVPIQEKAAEETPLPPVASLRGEDACLEFHRALNQPGGAAGNSYPYHAHAKDFDAIAAYAASCDDGNAGRTVLRALAEYFWLAPAGPIQSKRIERHRAKPKHLAENINRDAVEARNWYLARNRTEAAA